MDRFLVNPRPKPQSKPQEWAARLGVSQMAASQMVVAFLQLPPQALEAPAQAPA